MHYYLNMSADLLARHPPIASPDLVRKASGSILQSVLHSSLANSPRKRMRVKFDDPKDFNTFTGAVDDDHSLIQGKPVVLVPTQAFSHLS